MAFDPSSGNPTDPQAPAPIDAPDDALKTGSVIGNRYEVRGRLGAGGMGRVFRVHVRDLNEDIALKVVAAKDVSDPRVLDQLRDEVKAARKIAHKHVCKVFDYGEANGLRFLTMEIIEGRNLRALLRDGPVSRDRVVEMIQQIGAGLSAVHDAGMVHRDLKPENVVLRQNGEAVLVDFGLARSKVFDDPRKIIAGTPAYMSPEQLRGEKLDERSDIFALGVLAYELLTGRAPFNKESSATTIEAILHESPPAFESGIFSHIVEANVRHVLQRALAKLPADRFSSALEFVDAFAQAFPQQTSQEMAPALTPAFPKMDSRRLWFGRYFRRYRLAAIVLVGIVVVLLSRPWVKRTLRPERPVVVMAPIKNSTHDPSRDLLSSTATDAARTALLRLSEIDVQPASSDADARAAVLDGRAHWNLGGDLQGYNGLGLAAQFEHMGKVVGNQIDVNIAPTDHEALLLDRFKWRVLDEAWLLVRENERYRRADVGTGNIDARKSLLRYYDKYYVNVASGASDEDIVQGKGLLNHAIEEDPEYVQAFVERAYLNVKTGQIELARKDVNRAVYIDPTSAPARIMQCRVLQRALQANESAASDDAVNEAMKACSDALEVAPSSADVHLVFARLYNLRCDDGAAMKSLNEAKEKDRGQTGRVLAHYLQLALDGEDWGRADEASKELFRFEQEQHMSLQSSMIARLGIPPEMDAPLLRAIVLLHEGKEEEAREKFKEQLDWLESPDSKLEAVAIRGLLYRLPNSSLDMVKKYEPTLARSEQTIRDEIDKEPMLAIDVAWYYQWIDPAKAIEWLGLANASMGSKNAPSCSTSLRIANLYKAAGQLEKARAAAALCQPRFGWEQSCLAWVNNRLSR